MEVTGSGTTQHYEPLTDQDVLFELEQCEEHEQSLGHQLAKAERVAEVVQLMRDARLNRGTVMVDADTYYAAMAHLAKWEAARGE